MNFFLNIFWLEKFKTINCTLITTIAAIVSFVSILFNIYQFFFLHRGKLKIELENNIASINGGMTGNPIFNKVLEVTIINQGKNNRYIQNAMFVGKKNSYKKIKKFISYEPIENNTFPINIVAGDSLLLKYNLNNIAHQNLKEYNTIRALIYDTIGKKYKSNWIKVEVINES